MSNDFPEDDPAQFGHSSLEELLDGEEVLVMVADGLRMVGMDDQQILDAINSIQNQGVLFRGRYDPVHTIQTEGEEWIIHDDNDDADLITFDSWTSVDPERRAREIFAVYPRDAILLQRKVIRFHQNWVDSNFHRPDQLDLEGAETDG